MFGSFCVSVAKIYLNQNIFMGKKYKHREESPLFYGKKQNAAPRRQYNASCAGVGVRLGFIQIICKIVWKIVSL
jgi:hypothetical protein